MTSGPQRFERFIKFYKFRDWILKPPLFFTRIPLFSKLMGLMPKMPGMDSVHLTYIPVNDNIEVPPGTALPITIMENFIKEASYHVVLNECPCRRVEGCKDYPIDFGCTFLGEGAREINPAFSKHISAEECLDYFHKTVEAGLVPALGRFLLDAWMVGSTKHDKIMTMCHCCPCCCLNTFLGEAPGEMLNMTSNSLIKLEGVSVEVTDDCTSCGTCEKKCPLNAVHVIDKRAVMEDFCIGCGRCAIECPSDAIKITVDNPQYIQQAMRRISKVVDTH